MLKTPKICVGFGEKICTENVHNFLRTGIKRYRLINFCYVKSMFFEDDIHKKHDAHRISKVPGHPVADVQARHPRGNEPGQTQHA